MEGALGSDRRGKPSAVAQNKTPTTTNGQTRKEVGYREVPRPLNEVLMQWVLQWFTAELS